MSFMRGKYYVWHNGNNYIYLPEEMPMKVFDELVVMRYAEMSKRQIELAEKRALKKHYGNIGCDALAKKYGKKSIIKLALETVDKQK